MKFIDDCPGLNVAPLRASGKIRPAMKEAEVLVGKTKAVVKLAHTKFPHGGGYSFFICPTCAKLCRVLREHEGKLWCQRCLKSTFGRWNNAYRAEVEPRLAIERLAKLLNGGCPRVKGPKGRHTIDHKGRLEARLRQALIRQRAKELGLE